MMQSFLYDISERFSNLNEALEITDDAESRKAICEALKGMDAEINVVCNGGIGYINSLKALAKATKEEETRLKDRRTAIENRIKRIQQGYMDFLQAVGEKKVETSRGRMAIVNNGGKAPLDVYAPEQIPEKYLTVIPATTVPNNEAIRKALENGEEVPGAILQPRGKRLSIT